MISHSNNRRPLASLSSNWAANLTRALAATSVTPNQISIASMAFAALAGLAFYGSTETGGGTKITLLLTSALFCQLRLLCNLLDGMVAIEAGKSASAGAFWNEFSDRIADIFILVGAGFGASHAALGWAAASFAVLAAYVRELGRACGAPADYSGPMAKQHRMAVITGAALVAATAQFWTTKLFVLYGALWIIAFGAAVTTLRRARRLVAYLRKVVP